MFITNAGDTFPLKLMISFALCQIPHLCQPFQTCGGQAGAVGAEGQPEHIAGMAYQVVSNISPVWLSHTLTVAIHAPSGQARRRPG